MSTFVEDFKDYLYNTLNEGLDEYLTAFNSDKNIKWITIKGNHIPIKDGKTKDKAVKEFFNKKHQNISDDGLADSIAESIVKAIKDTHCNSKEPAEKFPKTIAGVEGGLPMTFDEADKGNCNPSYNPNIYGYSHNCQSCVVTYEARRRGYNVKAMPKDNSKTRELSKYSNWAWIDPSTKEKCDYTYMHTNNASEHRKYLENNVIQGQRFQYSFEWYSTKNKKNYRHVLIVERDNFGDLIIFDPQRNKIYKNEKLNDFLSGHNKTRILRIDDKLFNPYFMNDVMQKF